MTEAGEVKKIPNHFEMIGELRLYREIDDIDEKSTIFLIENTTLFTKNRRFIADYSPRKSSCALPKVRIGVPR